MPLIFVCDQCRRQTAALFRNVVRWQRPPHWFLRARDSGLQLACSYTCLKKLEASSGPALCYPDPVPKPEVRKAATA
jgi:hypothetical protein